MINKYIRLAKKCTSSSADDRERNSHGNTNTSPHIRRNRSKIPSDVISKAVASEHISHADVDAKCARKANRPDAHLCCRIRAHAFYHLSYRQ